MTDTIEPASANDVDAREELLLRRMASEIVDRSPAGALTVLDRRALDVALVDLGLLSIAVLDRCGQAGRSLFWIHCDGDKHGDGAWLGRNFGAPHLRVYTDRDPYDDWADEDPMVATHRFGTPTITEAAWRLAEHEAAHGPAVVVFSDPGFARPYDEILSRLLKSPDAGCRLSAAEMTYGWLAADLHTFAAAHQNGPTLVISDPGDARLHSALSRRSDRRSPTVVRSPDRFANTLGTHARTTI